MNGTVEFLVSYGYAALFACVLAEQLGLPLPAAPFLLAAGALASAGKLNLAVALLLAVAASLIGDTVWYYLGKTRGMAVLRLLCKISLEPDACVRRTKRGVLQTRNALVVVRQVYPWSQHSCTSDGRHLSGEPLEVHRGGWDRRGPVGRCLPLRRMVVWRANRNSCGSHGPAWWMGGIGPGGRLRDLRPLQADRENTGSPFAPSGPHHPAGVEAAIGVRRNHHDCRSAKYLRVARRENPRFAHAHRQGVGQLRSGGSGSRNDPLLFVSERDLQCCHRDSAIEAERHQINTTT